MSHIKCKNNKIIILPIALSSSVSTILHCMKTFCIHSHDETHMVSLWLSRYGICSQRGSQSPVSRAKRAVGWKKMVLPPKIREPDEKSVMKASFNVVDC